MKHARGKAYGIFGALLILLAAAARSIWAAGEGAEYVAAAGSQSLYRLEVAQSRGTIYDRDLEPLVGETRELVAAVAPTIQSIGALETATKGRFRSRLALALEEGKPFTISLPTLVEDPSIDLFSVPKRYQEDQLAPHVIGYLDSQGRGAAGIELAMDDLLAGFSGEVSVTYQVDALGRVIAGADRQVVDTLSGSRGGVALTLDRSLQELAEEAAEGLGKGAVVITQVPDCQILALASVPDFSPSTLGEAAEDPDSPLVNRGFSAYAPGSVFKLVVAAALLEGGSPLEDFVCTGSVNVDGLTFHCIGGEPHGEVGLEEALAQSCNCYFINAARSLGGQAILSMAYNLGLGAEQEFGRGLFTAAGELPGAASLQHPRALANFAFGQGELTATPLQLCAVLNTIASGGVYATPKLIAGEVDENKRLSPLSPVTDKEVRVMSVSTAKMLQRYLETAAQEGTGRAGAVTEGVCGIKTGTAQTGVMEDGEELLHFWYCGYVGEGDSPQYCITVLCESTPDDGGAAARAFRQAAQGLLKGEE